jgi:hypothetical protein
VLSGCTTDRASQPGAIIATREVEWGIEADISVDMTRKLTGSASKSRILFFTVAGPTKFVDGVFISSQKGLLTWIFGDYDDLKAAAAYEAVYGKADVLVNPQWAIEFNDYLLFAVTKCTVTGYAGKIRSFRNTFESPNRGALYPRTYADPSRRAFADPVVPKPGGIDVSAPSNVALASVPAPAHDGGSLLDEEVSMRDLDAGTGHAAVVGDIVSYHYSCRVLGGDLIFDSKANGLPRRRAAGADDAPIGLGKGLVGTRAGMHRVLTLPPSLAYGSTGLPSAHVPPNATLVIDLYIDQVTQPSP